MADTAIPSGASEDPNAAIEAIEIDDEGTAVSSFVEAASSAEVDDNDDKGDGSDIENQQQQQQPVQSQDDDVGDNTVEKPLHIAASANTAPGVGIFASVNDGDDDEASVFSFDSIEKQPRIPLRVQNLLLQQQQARTGAGNGDPNADSAAAVPFPSVVGASVEYAPNVVNVCPCRCLFFTLKETICLILSALGCSVYCAGLVLLIMYLEGSIFNNSGN